MSKHTPGPWQWIGEDALFGDDGEVLNAADDGRPWGMHSARIEHHYDPLIAKANRRLIAAAPEMYAALQPFAGIDLTGPTPADFAWMVLRARATLAKLDGDAHE